MTKPGHRRPPSERQREEHQYVLLESRMKTYAQITCAHCARTLHCVTMRKLLEDIYEAGWRVSKAGHVSCERCMARVPNLEESVPGPGPKVREFRLTCNTNGPGRAGPRED